MHLCSTDIYRYRYRFCGYLSSSVVYRTVRRIDSFHSTDYYDVFVPDREEREGGRDYSTVCTFLRVGREPFRAVYLSRKKLVTD